MLDICEMAFLVGLTDIPGLGPQLIGRLLQSYGRPKQVCSAPIGDLIRLGIPVELVEQITKLPEMLPVLVSRLEYYEEKGIELMSITQENYPSMLHSIPYPPPILYKRGTYSSFGQDSIAIVGARHASGYALKLAHELARKLAEDQITIFSGFARGVDTAAHQGALAGGGQTVAVFGSGLLRPYPRSNLSLAEDISERGACISECRPEDEPIPGRLMARNRIVSGLSSIVVVIECSAKGGTMDTVRYAKLQGRRLITVKWPKKSKGYAGWQALRVKRCTAIEPDDMDGAVEIIKETLQKSLKVKADLLFGIK